MQATDFALNILSKNSKEDKNSLYSLIESEDERLIIFDYIFVDYVIQTYQMDSLEIKSAISVYNLAQEDAVKK